MRARGTGTWIGGTAVLAVLVVLAGWFLLLSPLREDTAAVRAQADTAQQQNDLLELQLVTLRADAAKLPEYKAELEALRVQVPRTIGTTAILRELDALAQASGVQLQDISLMAPTEVVPAVAPGAPVAPVEPAADDEADTAVAPAAVPAATGPTAPQGLIGLDLALTLSGSPDAVNAFLTGMQDGSTRLFLVTGFDLSRQDEQGASGGQAAIAAGDLRTALRATVYVLPSKPSAAAPVAPDAAVDGAPAPAAGDEVATS